MKEKHKKDIENIIKDISVPYGQKCPIINVPNK